MKRIIAVFLAFCLLLLSACTHEGAVSKKKQIVASFYPVYIFTLNLLDGADDAAVSRMAEQNTGCLHDYQLLASDVRLLSDADAFVINGAGMEGFLNEVSESVGENLTVIDSSTGITLLTPADGKKNDEANSHIWLSVSNAIRQVKNIAAGLEKVLPEDRALIARNCEGYVKRLTSLRAELLAAALPVRGASVVTFHEAYDYMAKELSLSIVASIESDEGGEPSAKELAALSGTIKKLGVKALFTEPNYKGSSAQVLSSETGAKIYVLNPVTQGEKKLSAYEDIMRSNIETIVKAVH